MPELNPTAIADYSQAKSQRKIMAIIGGMGPLASAAFLSSIYERSLRAEEQLSPRILLLSDPSFPDRTRAILDGRTEALRDKLEEQIRFAQASGASSVVICCMTMHLILPLVAPELRCLVVSMVDLCLEEAVRHKQRQLMVCTIATRQFQLFQQHDLWPEAAPYIVYPDEADQHFIHDKILYGLKRKTDLCVYAEWLKEIMDKYGVSSFLAGCSELHLLAQYFTGGAGSSDYRCIDSLSMLADDLAEGRR